MLKTVDRKRRILYDEHRGCYFKHEHKEIKLP